MVVKKVADSMEGRWLVAFRYASVAASRVPPRQYPIALTLDSPVAFPTASSAATGPSSR